MGSFLFHVCFTWKYPPLEAAVVSLLMRKPKSMKMICILCAHQVLLTLHWQISKLLEILHDNPVIQHNSANITSLTSLRAYRKVITE